MMPGTSVDGATPKSVCRTSMWISCGVCVLGDGERASSVDGVPSDTLFSAAYILCQLGKEIRKKCETLESNSYLVAEELLQLGPMPHIRIMSGISRAQLPVRHCHGGQRAL
jgi:hypothetical protein